MDTARPTAQPIDLLEGIATTRAIRRLRPDPIAEEDLAQMLFAATRAPTGSNRQGFRFVVLRDGPKAAEAKALIGQASRSMWSAKRANDGYDKGSGATEDSPKARQARVMDRFVDNFEAIPVVVLACLIRHREPTPSEGASIFPACQNLLLAARALGYGGVFINFHMLVEEELREVLAIPENVAISGCIPLGRPEGGHGPVRRRPIKELVFEESWDSPAEWATEPEGTRHTGKFR